MPKHYPIRRGFNDLLGYHERRDDLKSTEAKKEQVTTRKMKQEEQMGRSVETPRSLVGQLSIDMLLNM